MKTKSAWLAAASVSLLGIIGLSFRVAAQQPQAGPAKEPGKAAAQQRNGGGFPDLVGGLKATPGCLGVETADTGSGKSVIFAWFKDKQSCLNWYYSDMHQGVMKRFFPQRAGEKPKPLADVPDDVGPIMAIASITFTDKSQFVETQLPISQIAIELYTPLTGGIYLGGRFAPESLELEGLRKVGPPQ